MNNEFYRGPELPEPNNTYQTGSTQPPKSNRGLISVLLVVVIILLGAVTILGTMNVRLFRQLNANTLDISLNSTTEAPQAHTLATERPLPTEDAVEITPSPTAAANATRDGGLSLQQICQTCVDSVVSISCTYHNGTSTGTGVILTEDGFIVTNCHVVEGASRIQILLQDGRVLDAQLVGADTISDLAVLQVEASGLSYAQLGDSSSLQVGDAVVAIGDPLGIELRGTMTDGIISAINRDVNVGGRVMNLIQTNAALNSGNSGGPLINCYGQVVGINTMKMGDSMSVAGVEGLGFAIPSNTVSDIVNQLIRQGYVSGRPTLGITGEDVSQFYQFYYNVPPGLYISVVENGSPADQLGLHPGDILLRIDEARISGVADYEAVLYTLQPGDRVNLVVYRSGRQYSVTTTVGEAHN